MKTPVRYLANELQRPSECSAFVNLLSENSVASYLEIGSKFGGTLWAVAQVLPRGSKIVSVEIEPTDSLRECMSEIKKLGHDITLIQGDSQDSRTARRVAQLGPFDAVLIDGDHMPEGVKADWVNYGPMGKLVAFHDVGWPKKLKPWRVGVPALWDSIKTNHRHVEIIDPDGIGFGILFLDAGLTWPTTGF